MMKHQIKIEIPKDYYEEQYLKENALLLSTCCFEKVVFHGELCMCTKCKKETKIAN